jgi:CBS domain-containing protein
MNPTFLELTAGDLMGRNLHTVTAAMPLRDAARELVRLGIHGAPVIDDDGRCVGVLSVSDLARWAAQSSDPTHQPRACSFQEDVRTPGGEVEVRCRLHPGACSLQRFREEADGRTAIVCVDPHGICTDWQVIQVELLPEDQVRHFMTTVLVTAARETSVVDLAQTMLDRSVHRVIVVDADGRPVGVVSVTDLLAAVARAGAGAGEEQ